METTLPLAPRPLLLVLALGLAVGTAQAQTTYRWVDKTGREVVSDVAPPKNTKGVEVVRLQGNDSSQPRYDARSASHKYPVELYTASDCGQGCADAKALLTRRGIPFAEKQVRSEDDLRTLKQLVSDPAAPTLVVGREAASGFQATAWNKLLDLAGYPKSK